MKYQKYYCKKCGNEEFKLITDGLRSIGPNCRGVIHEEDYTDDKIFTEDGDSFFECTNCYGRFEAKIVDDDDDGYFYELTDDEYKPDGLTRGWCVYYDVDKRQYYTENHVIVDGPNLIAVALTEEHAKEIVDFYNNK